MIKVVSVEQMRQIEAAADAAGMPYAQMMENAGRAVAERVAAIVRTLPNPDEALITVLVGPGSNGGDGLVAARWLAQEYGLRTRAYLLKPRSEDDENFTAARAAGVFIVDAENDQRYRLLTNLVASATIILDALFGIGIQLPLRDEVTRIMRTIHAALNEAVVPAEMSLITPTQAQPRPTRPYIIAVDCPSGLDCDTGMLDSSALHADETITFIAAKPGLFAFPGAAAVGELRVAPIDIPAHLDELKRAKHFAVDAAYVREVLPPRPPDAHKGTFGKVLVVGGSVNYTGAPGLAALAAYRVGAGLVTVGAPAPVIAALSTQLLEATWLLLPHDMGVLASTGSAMLRTEATKYNALVIGPGLNRDKTTRELLAALLTREPHARSARAIGFTGAPAPRNGAEEPSALPPMVVDADGLNLLGEIDNWQSLLPENTILTPHPGEMARLAQIETDEVQKKRWSLAIEKAAQWKVVLVLKGAHTLIAAPDGRAAVLPFKTSALATAGTGDVLAGMIGGMLAQGLKPFEAAVCAAFLHALAGVHAAKAQGSERSIIASDVLTALSAAFRISEVGA